MPATSWSFKTQSASPCTVPYVSQRNLDACTLDAQYCMETNRWCSGGDLGPAPWLQGCENIGDRGGGFNLPPVQQAVIHQLQPVASQK